MLNADKLGRVLASARYELGMSQAQMAFEVEIGQSQISRIEKGWQWPTFQVLSVWAELAEQPMWKLLKKAEEMSND